MPRKRSFTIRRFLAGLFLDNSFPTKSYWDKFIKSSISILTFLFVIVCSFILIGLRKPKADLIRSSSFRENKKQYIITLSIFLPAILALVFYILPISELIKDLARTIGIDYFGFILAVVTIYAPSIGFACYVPRKQVQKNNFTLVIYTFSFVLFIFVNAGLNFIFMI